jgi:hypothetical protein
MVAQMRLARRLGLWDPNSDGRSMHWPGSVMNGHRVPNLVLPTEYWTAPHWDWSSDLPSLVRSKRRVWTVRLPRTVRKHCGAIGCPGHLWLEDQHGSDLQPLNVVPACGMDPVTQAFWEKRIEKMSLQAVKYVVKYGNFTAAGRGLKQAYQRAMARKTTRSLWVGSPRGGREFNMHQRPKIRRQQWIPRPSKLRHECDRDSAVPPGEMPAGDSSSGREVGTEIIPEPFAS